MKIEENRIGFKKPNYTYLNPSVTTLNTAGQEMPERGIVYFNQALLEKYITNKKIKDFKLPNIDTIETGNITLKGLSIEKSGNILNEVRKNNQKEKIGQFKGHLLKTYNFTLNNRRAIIGHKVKMA